MRRNLSGGKTSVYRSILLTYLAVFLVPYVIGLAGNAYYESRIRSEMVSSWNYSLHQMQLVLDAELRSAQRTNIAFSANTSVQDLIDEGWFTAEDKIQAVALKSEIAAACGAMDHAKDIIIYFRNSQCLLTTTGRYPRETMHVYAETLGMTQARLLESLSGEGTINIRIVEGEKGKFVFALYHLYNYNYKSIQATVATVIPWDALSRLSAQPEHGLVSWLSQEGENFTLSGSGEAEMPWQILQTQGDDIHSIEEDGKIFLAIPSEVGAHTYVISMPHEIFYARSSTIRWVGIFQMAAALIAGLLTAFLSTRKSYRPIQRMISMMHDNQAHDGHETETFDRLETSLRELLAENRTLSIVKEEHEEHILNNQWGALIRGFDYVSTGKLKTIAGYAAIQFLSQPWILVLLEMNHPERSTFLQDGKGQGEQEWDLMLLALRRTIRETLLEGLDGVICQLEGSIAVIFPLMEEKEDTLELEQKISYTIQFVENAMDLRLLASVSRRHQHENEVRIAYLEAQQVSAYRQFWGRNTERILFFDGSSEDNPASDSWQDDMMQLRLMIRERNWEKARAQENHILDTYMSKDIHAMDSNRACVSSMALLLMNETPGMEQCRSEKEAILHHVLHADGMESFRRILDQLFARLQERVEIRLQDATPAWLDSLKAFVEANYQDPNLNTTLLAEKFELSLSYIGRTFKKYTGIGLLEYIHNVRIRHCRELLEAGMSVRETAEKTGYIDSKAMIRVFKKIVGMTPGQYRAERCGDLNPERSQGFDLTLDDQEQKKRTHHKNGDLKIT